MIDPAYPTGPTCHYPTTEPTYPGEPLLPDGTPLRDVGGLVIMRRAGNTTISVGGGLLPRCGRTIQHTPDGPIVTRFKMPAASHFYIAPLLPGTMPEPPPGAAPGLIAVNIPEADGVVYIDDELIPSSGKLRHLQSPPLSPGKTYPLDLRAAYIVGDHVMVETRRVTIRAGETTAANFDGTKAISVPVPKMLPDAAPKILPPIEPEPLPPPKR